MATQFDPDTKAYKQEFNGLGKDSFRATNQNSFNVYTNNHPNLPLVSPQSVLNAVELHQPIEPVASAPAERPNSTTMSMDVSEDRRATYGSY